MNRRPPYRDASIFRCVSDRIFGRDICGGYEIPRPLLVGEVRDLYRALLGPDGDQYDCWLTTPSGKGFADADPHEEAIMFKIRSSSKPASDRSAARINGFIDDDGNPSIYQLFLGASEEYRVFKTLERFFDTEERD